MIAAQTPFSLSTRSSDLQHPRQQSPTAHTKLAHDDSSAPQRPPSAPSLAVQEDSCCWAALRQHVAASKVVQRSPSGPGLAIQEDSTPRAALQQRLAASNAVRVASQTPEVLHWVYPPGAKLCPQRRRQAKHIGHMDGDAYRTLLS
jgi:hypothetical protein